MSAGSRVRAYYDALREGDPLYRYFAPDDAVVKFGLSEHLDGYEAVEAALRRQTRTTADWTVESRDLRVTERDRHAWFADRVEMGWTDLERDVRVEFDTRWTGTLEREAPGEASADSPDDWRFVLMHVSTPEAL